MIHRINPDIDIIKDLLEAVIKEQPASVFANSLLKQYCERGGLSKKQLEGLHSKASKFSSIPIGKLATLEAIILKKPNRYKSETPVVAPGVEKEGDTKIREDIEAILAVSPAHKRVLYFKLKLENKEPISALEIAEIGRFKKLLVK
jgi:hypothetical protein